MVGAAAPVSNRLFAGEPGNGGLRRLFVRLRRLPGSKSGILLSPTPESEAG